MRLTPEQRTEFRRLNKIDPEDLRAVKAKRSSGEVVDAWVVRDDIPEHTLITFVDSVSGRWKMKTVPDEELIE